MCYQRFLAHMMEENSPAVPAAPAARLPAQLKAMHAVSEALTGLTKEEQIRVMAWISSALDLGFIQPALLPGAPPGADLVGVQRPALSPLAAASAASTPLPLLSSSSAYATVHDLYAAAQPSGEAERALVVGYWLQVVQRSPDFDAQTVNSELRQLGYGVTNITQAFTNLMNRKPQYVIQTRKGGTTQQARKRLKLTAYGIQAVEKLIDRAREADEQP
jgi:hypothetical protein